MRTESRNQIVHNGREYQTNASDAELVQAARSGDKYAFLQIVARHQAMVCGVALGVLGHFSASEDAAQEAFLAAWRKLHDLRQPDRLRLWLGQIARNCALGHLRRQRSHESLDDAPVLADDSPAPDEVAASRDETELVRMTLAHLPEIYRLPLILYYREGESVRAVAEALDISEDAVKQRLARGREMMRERISGLMQTVLTRTAPGPVFTMMVAAAIGALAAPSAVAAGVITAASATAETLGRKGGAASTDATTLTGSKSFVLSLAIAGAVFVPVGYYLHTSGEPPPQPAAVSVPVQGLRVPSFEESAFMAEWRRLHEVFGITPESMPLLYKAMAETEDPFRRRAFHTALMAEWVQVDARGGFQFFAEKNRDDEHRRQFLEEWLVLDAPTAVTALLSGSEAWWKTTRDCLPGIARRAPSQLSEVVSVLSESQNYRDKQVRDAFAILAEGDLQRARKAAESVTGPNRPDALNGIARTWGKSDLDGAIAWARSLPKEADRDELIREALAGQAAVDPVAALELVRIVPGGGKYGDHSTSTAARVLLEAAKADFSRTVRWLTEHPGQFRSQEIKVLAGAVAEQLEIGPISFLNQYAAEGSLSVLEPALEWAILRDASGHRGKIWRWLKDQPENEDVRSLKKTVLNSAAFDDPSLALKLANDLPPGSEGLEHMRSLAQCLFVNGSGHYNLNQMLGEAPEHFRRPLLREAFDSLTKFPDAMVDPQPWIARISLLEEGDRLAAVRSLAQVWGHARPEQAISWAAALNGEHRPAALSEIASSWARNDAQSALEWVVALTPGAERDEAAHALSKAMAERYPQHAWKAVTSIKDSDRSRRATVDVMKIMARHDRPAALHWIESGGFTPELRTELEQALR